MCHNVVEELENNELEKKKKRTFSDSLNLKLRDHPARSSLRWRGHGALESSCASFKICPSAPLGLEFRPPVS